MKTITSPVQTIDRSVKTIEWLQSSTKKFTKHREHITQFREIFTKVYKTLQSSEKIFTNLRYFLKLRENVTQCRENITKIRENFANFQSWTGYIIQSLVFNIT